MKVEQQSSLVRVLWLRLETREEGKYSSTWQATLSLIHLNTRTFQIQRSRDLGFHLAWESQERIETSRETLVWCMTSFGVQSLWRSVRRINFSSRLLSTLPLGIFMRRPRECSIQSTQFLDWSTKETQFSTKESKRKRVPRFKHFKQKS